MKRRDVMESIPSFYEMPLSSSVRVTYYGDGDEDVDVDGDVFGASNATGLTLPRAMRVRRKMVCIHATIYSNLILLLFYF